jgi:hypothetical protein
LLTLTHSEAAALPEYLTSDEKLALLVNLSTGKSEKKSILPEPLCNESIARTKWYFEKVMSIIPHHLCFPEMNDNENCDIERVRCNYRTMGNVFRLKLKKKIFLTKIELVARIFDLPKINFDKETDSYNKKPENESYSATVSVFFYQTMLRFHCLNQSK